MAVAAGISWMFAAGPLSGEDPAPTSVVVQAHDDETGITGEVTLSEADQAPTCASSSAACPRDRVPVSLP